MNAFIYQRLARVCWPAATMLIAAAARSMPKGPKMVPPSAVAAKPLWELFALPRALRHLVCLHTSCSRAAAEGSPAAAANRCQSWAVVGGLLKITNLLLPQQQPQRPRHTGTTYFLRRYYTTIMCFCCKYGLESKVSAWRSPSSATSAAGMSLGFAGIWTITLPGSSALYLSPR